MLLFYIGIYAIVLALVWGLFVVVRIHAYKFKNFSSNIAKLTNLLFMFLISLSIIWLIIIFLNWTNTEVKVKDYWSFETKEVNY